MLDPKRAGELENWSEISKGFFCEEGPFDDDDWCISAYRIGEDE